MKKLLILLSFILIYITAINLVSCSGTPSSDDESTNTQSTTEVTTTAKPSSDPSHVHSYGAWIIVKPAACEVAGLRTRSCECGEIEENVLPALDHILSSHACTDAGKCSVCGKTVIDPGQHNVVDNVCTKCGTVFYTEEEVRSIIKIVNVSISRINSAGGVSVDIGWENRSSKTVKNAYFTVRALDETGTPVSCSIRGHYDTRLSLSGPVAPGENNYSVSELGKYNGCNSGWDNVWYNDTSYDLRLVEIVLEYDDGSSIALDSGHCEMAFSSMTLSENAQGVTLISSPQFTLTGGKGSQVLTLGIVSDEGYYIRKSGSVNITLTQLNMVVSEGEITWVSGSILYQQDHILSYECYISPDTNELTLTLDLDVASTGAIVFEMELSFTFDGNEEASLTHTVRGNMRIIAPSE